MNFDHIILPKMTLKKRVEHNCSLRRFAHFAVDILTGTSCRGFISILSWLYHNSKQF